MQGELGNGVHGWAAMFQEWPHPRERAHILINSQTPLPEILKEELFLVHRSCRRGVRAVGLCEEAPYAMCLHTLD